MHTTNPALDGPRTPTPPIVYDNRLWKARIWTTTSGIGGIPIYFKAPYGVYVTASQVLARAAARHQISRFLLGPIPTSELKTWKGDYGKAKRAAMQRYEDAFATVGAEHLIDWEA